MKKLIILLKLLFTISLFSTSAIADELKDFMLKQIQAKEFYSELYTDEYQAFFVVDDSYEVMTKADIKELMEIAKDENVLPTVKSFNILYRSETQDFISATFEYEWEISVGNTNMDGKVSGISVFLKTDEGYITIFDAQTQ